MSIFKKHHPFPPSPCVPQDVAGVSPGEMMCPPKIAAPKMHQPKMKLAHAYVPYQQYVAAFNPMEALHKGTLFPELFSPYEKKGGPHS